MEELRTIVTRLRAPDGCPWDREQTHASLRGGLLEEAHEVVEAIDAADSEHLREELGDVLLQVVMHSQIAEEAGHFDLDAVARGISEKLIRRHPHVFGSAAAATSGEVITQWDAIKRAEKASRGEAMPDSVIDGVSTALPALMQAEKITKKAAKVGFDWATPEQVIAKVREELAETEETLEPAALAGPYGRERVEEEIGDLLFAVANLARKAKVDPEVALRRATAKFSRRFRKVEAIVAGQGHTMDALTLEQLDAIWDTIKHEPESSR